MQLCLGPLHPACPACTPLCMPPACPNSTVTTRLLPLNPTNHLTLAPLQAGSSMAAGLAQYHVLAICLPSQLVSFVCGRWSLFPAGGVPTTKGRRNKLCRCAVSWPGGTCHGHVVPCIRATIWVDAAPPAGRAPTHAGAVAARLGEKAIYVNGPGSDHSTQAPIHVIIRFA